MSRAQNNNHRNRPTTGAALQKIATLSLIGIIAFQALLHVWADARAGRLACALANRVPAGVQCVADVAAHGCSPLVGIMVDLEMMERRAIKDACWRPDPLGVAMAWIRHKDQDRITLQADPKPDDDIENEEKALQVAQKED